GTQASARARRPSRRLVYHPASLLHLKARDPHSMVKLSEIADLFPIDALDRRDVIADLLVQRLVEPHSHEDEDSDGKHADHHGEDARVPQGEPRSETRIGDLHPRSTRSTNPTPRTVWRSLGSSGSSIFRRRRATVTSITLSSGVARALTRQTS